MKFFLTCDQKKKADRKLSFSLISLILVLLEKM